MTTLSKPMENRRERTITRTWLTDTIVTDRGCTGVRAIELQVRHVPERKCYRADVRIYSQMGGFTYCLPFEDPYQSLALEAASRYSKKHLEAIYADFEDFDAHEWYRVNELSKHQVFA